jgi:hypothetical protein
MRCKCSAISSSLAQSVKTSPMSEQTTALSKRLFPSPEVFHNPVAAVRVWEGESRGTRDLTDEFGDYARMKGLNVFDVMTR